MEWFEDENFWNNYSFVMFDSQVCSQSFGISERIIEIAGLKENAEVLDVCCGPGRISLELALQKMKVTGVDIMESYLEAARESAKDENVSIDYINHDMRTFESNKKFDCAVNVYNSFGYCDKIEDDYKILDSVYKSLKKGGTFILECISRETAIRYFTKGEDFKRDNCRIITEFKPTGAWEGLNSKWTIITPENKKIEHQFVQRLYSAADLRDKLKETGFSSVEVYGGFDLRPYDYDASTMVLVCRK